MAVLGLLFTAAISPQILTVDLSVVIEPKVWTQEMVKELAIEQTEKYRLHKGRFLVTLKCENDFNATGQSQHKNRQIFPEWYTPVGDPNKEQSFGAAMINLPSHKGITREMAEDPTFAIPWMAKKWVAGDASLWSCWRAI